MDRRQRDEFALIILEVKEAVLRYWNEGDAAALLAAARSSADLEVQLGSLPRSLDEAVELIAAWEPTEQSRNFAIDLGGQAVGNVGISRIEQRHNTGWVHYWVGSESRGRGLAAAGLAGAAAWAFGSLDLFRLELGHRVNNAASCRVASLAGFSAEGIQRQKLRYDDERFDVELHARLLSDLGPAIAPLAVAP